MACQTFEPSDQQLVCPATEVDQLGNFLWRRRYLHAEPSQYPAPTDDAGSEAGVGRKEVTKTGEASAAEHCPRDISARHCRSATGLTEYLGQDIAALTPFDEHSSRLEVAINVGVGVRMAPYEVTSTPELPDLTGIEERSLADKTSCNEEVTPPVASAQLLTNGERALAPIIECQQQMPSRPGEIKIVQEIRAPALCGYAVEMIPERLGGQLVRSGTIPLEAGSAEVVGNIVIAETRDERTRWPGAIRRATHAPAG